MNAKDDHVLIDNMRRLRNNMLHIAEQLDDANYAENSRQLRGAAAILLTWIDGLRDQTLDDEHAQQQAAAHLDVAA